MITVTNEDSFKNLPENYILYFYATWMPKSVGSHMFRMLNKDTKYTVLAVDVESFKSYVKVHQVEAVPTLIFFKGREPVKRIEGYMLTATFRATARNIYEEKGTE